MMITRWELYQIGSYDMSHTWLLGESWLRQRNYQTLCKISVGMFTM